MEKISKSILETFLKNFMKNNPIKNILILEQNGKMLISAQNLSKSNDELIGIFKNNGFLENEFKKNCTSKNLKQIIFDYLNDFVILSLLETEGYIITFINQKTDLFQLLNNLKTLIKKVEEFLNSKNTIEKFSIIKLDEDIKKLESYLEIMQPPTFRDIKKLIEYIS
ncbi:MAG: hypothetical protein ACTSRG_13840 [Candidatus Helarchaeota archaeon]